MCRIIDADAFMALVLSHVDSIEFPKLRQIRSLVERETPNIVISFAGAYIALAEAQYPRLFQFNADNFLVRPKGSEGCFTREFVRTLFFSRVPIAIQQEMDSAIVRALGNQQGGVVSCVP